MCGDGSEPGLREVEGTRPGRPTDGQLLSFKEFAKIDPRF